MANFIEQFKREIEQFAPGAPAAPADRGIVSRVGDGVAEIEGLEGARMSEMIRFDTAHGKNLEEALKAPTDIFGVVLNLEEGLVRAIILGDTGAVAEGMGVMTTGEGLSVPVGDSIAGRIVNSLCEPLDGLGAIQCDRRNPVERIAYGVMDRQSVNSPLHTVIKAIDSMIPIGRGQRELIIGDRYTGKTTIAIDTILNQKYEPKEK